MCEFSHFLHPNYQQQQKISINHASKKAELALTFYKNYVIKLLYEEVIKDYKYQKM